MPTDPVIPDGTVTGRHPLIGTRWRINDTGGTFVVEDVVAQYARVRRANGAQGRILASSIRPSYRRTGYTPIGAGED